MLTVGTQFAGRFTVVRELAAGGMGAVYEVRDPRTAERRALKVMLPHLVRDPKQRERFEREARVGGQIPSGYVVKVLDTGIDDATGQPWLLMEYLEGETLEARVKREGALLVTELSWMMAEVGHALGAAHGTGVLHLDLKPANLFLAKTYELGKPARIKVLDFGIARVMEAGRTSNELTSQSGTLAWMAPEQADKGTRVRPTIDVWPLGLIAFYALTGKEYWTTSNLSEEDYTSRALLLEVQIKPLVPASVRAGELGVAARLPAGFDGWFARCVTREPGDRWPDGAAAANALLPLLTPAAGPRARTSGTDVWTGPPSVPSLPPMPPARGSTEAVPPSPEALRGQTEVAAPYLLPQSRPAGRAQGGRAVWLAVPALLVLAGVGVWAATRGTARGGEHTTGAPTDTAVTEADAAAPRVVPTPSVPTCPEGMVRIPGGTFQMGSPEGVGDPDEHPQHAVTVAPYCMDRTEVTVGAYRRCVSAAGNPCTAAWTTVDYPGIDTATRQLFSQWCNGDREDRTNHPVNCVDWTQADAYCRWTGGRLPTEAEWEYGARGTDGRTYPWGEAPPGPTLLNACGSECVAMGRAAHQTWTGMYPGDDGWGATAPVGNYSAGRSPFGLDDMAGNVLECTSDWYGNYSASGGSPVNGTHRVDRGGGWDYNPPARVRASNRYGRVPVRRYGYLGFRCARGGT